MVICLFYIYMHPFKEENMFKKLYITWLFSFSELKWLLSKFIFIKVISFLGTLADFNSLLLNSVVSFVDKVMYPKYSQLIFATFSIVFVSSLLKNNSTFEAKKENTCTVKSPTS